MEHWSAGAFLLQCLVVSTPILFVRLDTHSESYCRDGQDIPKVLCLVVLTLIPKVLVKTTKMAKQQKKFSSAPTLQRASEFTNDEASYGVLRVSAVIQK